MHSRVCGDPALARTIHVQGGAFGMGSDRHYPEEAPTHAVSVPDGGRGAASHDATAPSARITRKTVKGGSRLGAPNDCRHYRPAARHRQPIDTGMSHVGFRCVVRMQRPAQGGKLR